ncbi:hypothetical protein [Ghiorsea bivora]|uniref:hypothetical protein n=1 Tax=Ghiorsea bivora TaxID=1485545 RepID=UPI0018E08127|nr:hypothetical protein [Ghiorsea bivora]
MVKSHPVRKNSGVISDETIRYSSATNKKRGLKAVRKVVYKDEETGKIFTFITNHFHWSANPLQVCTNSDGKLNCSLNGLSKI